MALPNEHDWMHYHSTYRGYHKHYNTDFTDAQITTFTSLNDEHIYVASDTGNWYKSVNGLAVLITSGGGEANTSSNVGSGEGLALAKVGFDLPFKSLTAGSNITLTPNATEIEISAIAGAGVTASDGIVVTAANVTLGSTIGGSGTHDFTADRFQYLDTFNYQIDSSTGNVITLDGSTNRIGIGITAPLSKLHVYGIDGSTTLESTGSTVALNLTTSVGTGGIARVSNSIWFNTPDANFLFYELGQSGQIQVYDQPNNASGYLRRDALDLEDTGGTSSAFINADGDSYLLGGSLGIGVNPPLETLHVGTGNIRISSLTASEIVATDASSNLQTLDVATYPSLVELSYVKGVTSGIQAQINAKFTLPALTSGSVLFSDGITITQDNTNLFWNDSTNKLGIGTATPDRKLDILDTSVPQLRLTYTDNSIYTDLETNSSGQLLLKPTGGVVRFGLGASNAPALFPIQNTPTAYSSTGKGLGFFGYTTNDSSVTYTLAVRGETLSKTSGAHRVLSVGVGFTAASGNATLYNIAMEPTYNQTAAATGSIYGILYSPNVTSITGLHYSAYFNTGDFVVNSGNTGLGNTTPSAKLDITGLPLTGSTANSAINVVQTWNTSGTPTAIFLNITDTASNASSLLLDLQVASTSAFKVTKTGSVSIGNTTPSARLHLPAGSTTAATAPLKFTSGSLMTVAEAGAVEFLTDDFYGTITTGAARKKFVLDDGTNLTSGRIPFATTNGRLTDDADLTFATDTLTATKIVGTTSVKIGTAAGFITSDGSTGLTGTYTFGGGASGEVATLTFKDGILTGATLVP